MPVRRDEVRVLRYNHKGMSLVVSTVALALGMVGLQSSTLPPIVPMPTEYVRKTGQFEILPSTVIVADNRELGEADRLARMLRKSTGYPLPIRPTKPVKDYIEFDLKPEMKWLGEEGYRVSVRSEYVTIRSFGIPGLFYGAQSFRQMLPKEIESDEAVFRDWNAPAAEISDAPRFEWRGMHLDVSRHFFGVDEVKKFIDLLALYKFNRFHWHLVDDGGWRIEIKGHPDLTRVGAWRIGDGRGWDHSQLFFNQNDGVYQVYGGYYTQDQVREVVEYAALRHITVVPEIEMPGHSLPALWVRRDLACDEASVNRILPQIKTQFVNTYCPGKEATYKFLTQVLDEVVELFPGDYVHIGGDEVDKRTWTTCSDCLGMRERQRLDGNEELYGFFMRRMASYLKSKGKTAVAWDEVLEGGLPGNTVVMSWRGEAGAKAAIQAGARAVMAPQQLTYFDHSYQTTPMKEVYGFDPVPKGVTAEQSALIKGGQGQVWTERLEQWGDVEQAVFPRILALSESLWSDSKAKDWARFEAGVQQQIARLDQLEVQSHVPEPEFDYYFVAFRDSVTLNPPKAPPGMSVKRTRDGSVPRATSEGFDRPFVMTESGEISVAFMRANGAVGKPVSVRFLRVEEPVGRLVSGLWADWYSGRFRDVDGFSGSVERTDVPTWANQWRFLGDPFGVRFHGVLAIPADGVYTFYLRSDDGSRLRVGGRDLIDLTQVGGTESGAIQVRLVKGRYPFELLYFNAGGSRELLWEVEAAGFRRRSVPTEWLFREE